MAKAKAVVVADGAALWVATPAIPAAVPAKDELYDRKADPFQLHDVANKNPKKAAELYGTLTEFMVGLRKS
jgi:hypothetical protein